jgi:hypothetical protein
MAGDEVDNMPGGSGWDHPFASILVAIAVAQGVTQMDESPYTRRSGRNSMLFVSEVIAPQEGASE